MQRSVLSAIAVFFVVGSLLGCGPGGDGLVRVPVRGEVRVGTIPATEGHVRFVPAQGNPGPVAAASIRDGRYVFTTSEGPTAGPHDVIVEVRLTAAAPAAPAQSGAKGGGPSGAQTFKTTVVVDPDKTEVDLQFEPANASAS